MGEMMEVMYTSVQFVDAIRRRESTFACYQVIVRQVKTRTTNVQKCLKIRHILLTIASSYTRADHALKLLIIK